MRRPLDAEADPLVRDRIAEVDAGIGVCMMYRREAALELGGYDEGFQPVWFDDLDLSLSHRARLGLKNFYYPGVHVDHQLALRASAAPPPPPRQRLVARASGIVGERLPSAWRERLALAANLDRPAPEQAQRLRRHYAYWQRKWGWDPLNPDMDAVRRRWGDTEVCWALDDGRRAAGEDIVSAFWLDPTGPEPAVAMRYLRRYGFLPPPRWTAMTAYDHILDAIRSRDLVGRGDFVEIGAFLGGGVYQLARLLEHAGANGRVIAIDIFAPQADETRCTRGRTMAEIYAELLPHADQREVYDAVVAPCRNVVTIAGDSADVEIPSEAIAFAHVDGNHDPEYVRGDFERVWGRMVPGGVVAFDDYGHDLPEVTETVDALRREHAGEIADSWVAGFKTAFVQKR
jgi:hypothetical protein